MLLLRQKPNFNQFLLTAIPGEKKKKKQDNMSTLHNPNKQQTGPITSHIG